MSELLQIISNLSNAVDVIMNPNSSQSQRNQANSYIEQLKNSCEPITAITLSVNILDNHNSSLSLKHLAFQLIQHSIIFNWNSMNDGIKHEIKSMMECWISKDEISFGDSKHLMHVASRCIIEVMKREWPAKWPNFMNLVLSKRKCSFCLFIIWRLAEDIGVFYLPNNQQRRREMNHELNDNKNAIYEYICECLICGDFQLCLNALTTLNGFLDWSTFDLNVFKLLCQIIDSDIPNKVQNIEIKKLACNCLLICLNRKSLKNDDKLALQSLLNDYNMNHILNAVKYVNILILVV